ncbi:hypothetical protein SAMN02910447_03168 [Ruminococcus sp. YE71]|uniref:hypothetical protein n=1 Tax=unclassified Ruminococcus TaxID=2608920 RepID=UPI000891D33E|nr:MULTISPECIES: hypothetical protein [unclassified Ruminococcus]SDA30316.1 hypothetical protein SAMN02910446_03239 [Ruminococcus sp. YE78]SFW49412.1 hypothetical protein SAMN02910447_03168 [Ruminococcus sp. YE71]
MSDADVLKQEKEYNTFLEACEYCETNNVNIRTLNIMRFLNGIPISRQKNDRPDIICNCNKGKKEYIVGIEMFLVDQNSKNKKGKLRSPSQESKAIINKIYDKGHDEIIQNGQSSKETKESLLSNVVNSISNRYNSSYDDLIAAFKYNFDKHAENVQEYRKNVMAYANGKEIKIAFFIEVESHFFNLFLNDRRVVEYKSYIMPFFRDIINIINSNPNNKYIDYYVFYLTSYDKIEKKVVAIRSGNIRKNIESQNIIVYEYVGESFTQIITSETKYKEEENGDYSVKLNFTNPAIFQEELSSLCQKALILKKKRIPFVTTRIVQSFLYSANAKTMEEQQRLREEFVSKYPVEEQQRFREEFLSNDLSKEKKDDQT